MIGFTRVRPNTACFEFFRFRAFVHALLPLTLAIRRCFPKPWCYLGQITVETCPSRTIGRIAITLAVVALMGLLFITLRYSFMNNTGIPFGTLNNLCAALGGILSGGLAVRIYSFHRAYAPRASWFTLLSAYLGATIVSVGSVLAIFDTTGWFLVGLVVTFGYDLIGLWLLAWNYSAPRGLVIPRLLA